MRITFHGAAQTVTGSRHLISINGSQLLLDCGLFQGRRADTYTRNLNFPFDPQQLGAVVLSHAHLDHCGNLPSLAQDGFHGSIHATPATCHLTELLLLDSANIQEADVAYVNKRRARTGEPPVKPLYTVADAQTAIGQLDGQGYDQSFSPLPGVTARMVEAGHILGSAAIILELEERGRKVRLMFSGDIGRHGLPIIRDPVLPDDVDYLIMECTYGDKSHDSPDRAYDEMKAVVWRTFERGGKLIVPAFALGRTQTLVYYLHQMVDRKEIPSVPVYVDSPLAVNVTDVFEEHPELFDEEARAVLRVHPRGEPFGFDKLTFTRSVEASKAINERKGPLVIISASGMAENGRILHHLRNNVGDPRNTVLITSWMAPHTLGRRLVERQPRVRIFGDEYEVRAEVTAVDGLSAHAGQEGLLAYARAVRGRARAVFLVHGEPGPAAALKAKLGDMGSTAVHYPEPEQFFEL